MSTASASPALPSSPSVERPTKRKKYEKAQDQQDADGPCQPFFKGDAPFLSSPPQANSEDWPTTDMGNTGMECEEMLPMEEEEKIPGQIEENDSSGMVDIMEILGDCVVFEDGL